MRILLSACLSAMLLTSAAADAVPRRPFTIDDMLAIRDVSEIDISADGLWVAHTVSSADRVRDEEASDIWMSSWDGRR